MSGFDPDTVRRTYSAMAEDYAVMYGDDLPELEVNRQTLDVLAERTRGRGPVVDLGCGPAQAGGYLAAAGGAAIGLDPASGMLAVARARNPGLPLVAGDMTRLPLRGGSCAGLVAFCVFHHVPRPGLGRALRELRRVLAPGGVLLLATHEGRGVFTATGIDGAEVTCTLYEPAELGAALGREGFTVDDVRHRGSLPHERDGTRVYVTATAGTTSPIR